MPWVRNFARDDTEQKDAGRSAAMRCHPDHVKSPAMREQLTTSFRDASHLVGEVCDGEGRRRGVTGGG